MELPKQKTYLKEWAAQIDNALNTEMGLSNMKIYIKEWGCPKRQRSKYWNGAVHHENLPYGMGLSKAKTFLKE